MNAVPERGAGGPTLLRRLASSGSLRGAILFAIGGAGFALANIILAAVLPPAQFGLLALMLALIQFGLSCGPLGLDVVVKRHCPRVTFTLLRTVATNTILVAVGIALAARPFYGLSLSSTALLAAGGALAGANWIAVGVYQARAQMSWSLTIAQGPNYILLLLAVAALLLHLQNVTPIIAGVVLGYLVLNLAGWTHARSHQDHYQPLAPGLAFREGMASVSIGFALQLLWQLERVAIPKLLSVDDLATYSVLAAIVGAPFRVTQFGVGFTLIEKLRNAPDADAARAILGHEILVALLLVIAATAGVLVLSPIVFHWVLHDKYRIGWPLMAVTIAVGMVRVAEGFSTTAVTALGSAGALARISAMGWVSLGVAIVGAIIGSRAGLVGIVAAALLGWLTLCASGCVLAIKSFHQRFAVPVAHPT